MLFVINFALLFIQYIIDTSLFVYIVYVIKNLKPYYYSKWYKFLLS